MCLVSSSGAISIKKLHFLFEKFCHFIELCGLLNFQRLIFNRLQIKFDVTKSANQPIGSRKSRNKRRQSIANSQNNENQI